MTLQLYDTFNNQVAEVSWNDQGQSLPAVILWGNRIFIEHRRNPLEYLECDAIYVGSNLTECSRKKN